MSHPSRLDLLQGTLDLLILRTLQSGQALHGWAISERIQQLSQDVWQLNQGSLYPALHRLEHQRRGGLAMLLTLAGNLWRSLPPDDTAHEGNWDSCGPRCNRWHGEAPGSRAICATGRHRHWIGYCACAWC